MVGKMNRKFSSIDEQVQKIVQLIQDNGNGDLIYGKMLIRNLLLKVRDLEFEVKQHRIRVAQESIGGYLEGHLQ